MLDPLGVDEGVHRDQRGDREPQGETRRIPRARAADEEDAGGHEQDARALGRRRDRPQEQRADEHEHRRPAAGHRVDDAHLGACVRGREREEVDELQQTRCDEERNRLPLDVVHDERDRRREDDARADRHDGRGEDVARAGEQHVPARVETAAARASASAVAGTTRARSSRGRRW